MRYILSLGGNLGDVEATMRSAIRRIAMLGIVPLESKVYESEPWGFEAKERFKNMTIELDTGLEPLALLDELQRIEREMGRDHKTIDGQYQSRNIDIDILLCDERVVDTERLTIPHKLMHLREFALAPTAEHWADWWHPILGKTVGELLAQLG
ncbi:MAG: 2-amino-4-hydroxy-6-hydroxymethyldihydropteridine diphosphokinase [Bacteroidia bacterium]|nr:2-amino-4-hydroxy-6-hydroxymethyldihydropteridine diphosphokinase [Bacteroidia bacterium]